MPPIDKHTITCDNTTMSEEPRRDWTTAELAKAGHVDPSRLRHMILSGDLVAVKRGHTWLIADAHAQAWLAKPRRRKPATKE